MDEVRERITREGQRFYDEPVVVMAKTPPAIALAVQAALDPNATIPTPKTITVAHRRVQLQWMKPDGKGGLVPR